MVRKNSMGSKRGHKERKTVSVRVCVCMLYIPCTRVLMALHGCVCVYSRSVLSQTSFTPSSSKHGSPFLIFFLIFHFFNLAAWLLPKSQLIWNDWALIPRTVHRVHFIAPLVACLLCQCVSVCDREIQGGRKRPREIKCSFFLKFLGRDLTRPSLSKQEKQDFYLALIEGKLHRFFTVVYFLSLSNTFFITTDMDSQWK